MTKTVFLSLAGVFFILATAMVPAQAPLAPQILYPQNGTRGYPVEGMYIEWAAPDGGDPTVEQYDIYLGSYFMPFAVFDTIDAPATRYDFASGDLRTDTEYEFNVVARNSEGNSTTARKLYFSTIPTQEPITVRYYVDRVRELISGTEYRVTVDFRDNPDGAAPLAYTFDFAYDPDRFRLSSVTPPISDPFSPDYEGLEPQIGLSARVQAGDFGEGISRVTGNTLSGPDNVEGYLLHAKFFLQEGATPLQIGETPPIVLQDATGVSEPILSSTDQEIDHVFQGYAFIRTPQPATLISPPNFTMNLTEAPKLEWTDSLDAREWKIYVWNFGSPVPQDPVATFGLTEAHGSDDDDGIREYQLPAGYGELGKTYLWKVDASNIGGTFPSATWRYIMEGAPTPTPSPTATPTMTETPTPTVSPTATPTDTPTASPSPSATATPSPTEATATPSPTASPSISPTPSSTASPSPSPTSDTPTPSPSQTSTGGDDYVNWLLSRPGATEPDDLNLDQVIDVADFVKMLRPSKPPVGS